MAPLRAAVLVQLRIACVLASKVPIWMLDRVSMDHCWHYRLQGHRAAWVLVLPPTRTTRVLQAGKSPEPSPSWAQSRARCVKHPVKWLLRAEHSLYGLRLSTHPLRHSSTRPSLSSPRLPGVGQAQVNRRPGGTLALPGSSRRGWRGGHGVHQ